MPSSTLRETLFTCSEGPIEVNGVTVRAESPDVVALWVDCRQKYPDPAITWANTIGLYASDETMHVKDKRDGCSILTFTEYDGWSVHSVDMARYTIAVCLVREEQNCDEGDSA